ncbi:hypothetical protein CKK34_5036 [Yarrowia sp. E02]|nr:hypothetical protein CKK34_5036 [Yarrowia sp. E02]
MTKFNMTKFNLKPNNENYDPHKDILTNPAHKTNLSSRKTLGALTHRSNKIPESLPQKDICSTPIKDTRVTQEDIRAAWAAHPTIPEAEISIKLMHDRGDSDTDDSDDSIDSRWLSVEIDRVMNEETTTDLYSDSDTYESLEDAFVLGELIVSESMDLSNISRELAWIEAGETKKK